MLDRANGGFLQSESLQTEPGDGVDPPLPAVTGYTLFLSSARTSDTTTIP